LSRSRSWEARSTPASRQRLVRSQQPIRDARISENHANSTQSRADMGGMPVFGCCLLYSDGCLIDRAAYGASVAKPPVRAEAAARHFSPAARQRVFVPYRPTMASRGLLCRTCSLLTNVSRAAAQGPLQRSAVPQAELPPRSALGHSHEPLRRPPAIVCPTIPQQGVDLDG